jgi:hypothetical protein
LKKKEKNSSQGRLCFPQKVCLISKSPGKLKTSEDETQLGRRGGGDGVRLQKGKHNRTVARMLVNGLEDREQSGKRFCKR